MGGKGLELGGMLLANLKLFCREALMAEGLGEREGRLLGVLAFGLKCPGDEP